MAYLKGMESPNHKLTNEDVIEIRRAYRNKEDTQVNLAKKFGVSQNRISKIVNGFSWTHLLEEG